MSFHPTEQSPEDPIFPSHKSKEKSKDKNSGSYFGEARRNSFSNRFYKSFRCLDDLPPPDIFTESTKTYPSRRLQNLMTNVNTTSAIICYQLEQLGSCYDI